MEETLEFDDVLIKPVPSSVSSRDEVCIDVKLSDSLTLKFPLIASPMIGIVNGQFAHLLSKLGGLAIIHRFYPAREDLFADIAGNINLDDNYGISIRIDEEDIEEYFQYKPKVILIDTANGYTEKLLRYCEKVKNIITERRLDILLMAGNVTTAVGCKNLHDSGCDLIRLGIGGGSPCSTRNQTGIGIPSISALMECDDRAGEDYKIIIDGGIKNSGDFVKSIIAGADFGMSGLLYGQCYEAPHKGTIYGLASRTNMKNTNTEIKSVEGIDIPVEKKYSLEQFVREFGYGIKSAGTYLNAKTLGEIYGHGSFVKVSDHAIKKGL
jgi:IMP dehydrogenase/GMP reductase